MITSFKIFESDQDEETRVRIMAWLYMLFIYDWPGTDGMEESWLKDDRMGITFGESVKLLKKEGLCDFINNKWKITEKGKKELIDFFNPPKTREEWLDYDNSWLKKYDINDIWKGFVISRIPTELFDRMYKEESKNQMQYTLSKEEYNKIKEWWLKYQRGTIGWWTQLNKYLGLKNELITNVNEMTLYRGLNFNMDYPNVGLLPNNEIKTINRGIISVMDLKVGDKIICSKPSWTMDLKVARMFASGKKGWGDTRNMKSNEIGIVLKHTFPSSELFLDTNWAKNNNFLEGEAVLPQEMEIIVRPRQKSVDIVEVFNSEHKLSKINSEGKYME
jgi:hypothetical protein